MNTLELINFDTLHTPRAYVNSVVHFQRSFTQQEREKSAKEIGWNVFQFPAEMVTGADLLSDSGTTTITDKQFAALTMGDESYGSNSGYFLLMQVFEDIFGIPQSKSEVFLFHQGRAAEHALFTQIGKLGNQLMIPNNGHFDTTAANICMNRMKAINLFSSHLQLPDHYPFKGNMNVEALEKLLAQNKDRIPLVYCTITNNTGGGQPVSLENLHRIRQLCDKYGKPFFLDACRFAENAWFIKQHEAKYKDTSIADIVKEMFALCDAFTISLKKDGLANMGGALVFKKESPFIKEHPSLLHALRDHQILTEGHPTYGGISGRDIMVIATGLPIAITETYLNSRIKQVEAFGHYMLQQGIPVLTPFGGHAVYIDMNAFFEGTKHQAEDFGGIALTGLLLLKGVRLCELGNFAFGTYDPLLKKETFPAHHFVRCAIPRNKYELEDLKYVADCIKGLYDRREEIPRAVPIYGRELSLRHFKAKFELQAIT